MLKKLISVFLGNGLYALSQLLLVVYMGKYLGEKVLSEYVFSVALCSPIYMFFGGGIRNFCSVDVQAKYSDSVYAECRFYFLCLGLVTVLLLSFFLSIELGYVFYFVIVVKLLEGGLETLYGAYQRASEFGLIRNYNIFRSFSVFFLIFLMFYFEWFDLKFLFVFQIIVLVGILVFVFSGLRGEVCFEGFALAKKLFCLSFSFGVMAMVSNFNLNLPRFFLGLSSSVELAKYALLYQIVFLGSVIVIAFSQVILPLMAKRWNDGNYRLWFLFLIKSYLVCTVIFLLLLFLSYYYGVEFFYFVFGDSYSVVWQDIALMLTLGLFSYFLNISSVAFQSSVKGGVVKWAVVSTVFHGALLFFLIPLMGMKGAIFSTISYLFLYNGLLFFIVFNNYFKVKV